MKKCKPFKPFITLEQVFNYDPKKKETYTISPFVNAVLDGFYDPELRTAQKMGYYYRLNPRHISNALLIATGHTLPELKRLWVLEKAERYKKEHPKCSPEELCRAVGYKSRTSLWQAINAPRINRQKREHWEEWRAHKQWLEGLSIEDREEYERKEREEEEERKRKLAEFWEWRRKDGLKNGKK